MSPRLLIAFAMACGSVYLAWPMLSLATYPRIGAREYAAMGLMIAALAVAGTRSEVER